MDALKDMAKGLLWGLLLCLIATLLWGCRTVKLVPVPEYHVRDSVVLRHTRDSVYLHDSVYVTQYKQGDTVYRVKEKYITRWRNVQQKVVGSVVKTDSIHVPDYLVTEKPQHLTWYERTMMSVGAFTLLSFTLWLIVTLLKRKT